MLRSNHLGVAGKNHVHEHPLNGALVVEHLAFKLEEELLGLDARRLGSKNPVHANLNQALGRIPGIGWGLWTIWMEQVEVFSARIDMEGVDAVLATAPEYLLGGLLARDFEFLLKVKEGEGIVGDDTGRFSEGL